LAHSRNRGGHEHFEWSDSDVDASNVFESGMSWTHNPSNLPMLLAGGSRLGLRHGNHLRFNPHKDLQGRVIRDVRPQETTVCDVLRTMSERLSVPAERFGDSRRVVSEILA
jgi:hypothetical protein